MSLVSKYHSPKWYSPEVPFSEKDFLKKWLILRLGQGKYQMCLWHLIMSQSKCSKNKRIRVYQMDMSQCERVPKAKAGTI